MSPNSPISDYTSYWLDSYAIKNSQCLISSFFLSENIALLEERNLTKQFICFSNLPLRLWSSYNAYQNKEYWKLAFDVASFSCLFFPQYGVAASVCIDLATGAIDGKKRIDKYFSDRRSEFGIPGDLKPVKIAEIDCTNREIALQVFNITEEMASNRALLDDRYKFLISEWEMRIRKSQCSPPLNRAFRDLKERVEISYKTLTR